ncbi:hypothetical protein LCM17_12935 [Cereibacter sphaeroides]|nr:hypothetical protein [Cereibacter sphaeroides]
MADTGYGAILGREATAGSGNYAKIAVAKGLVPPGFTRDKIDATTLESADEYKEFIAGMFDTDDASMKVNFVPSETDVFYAALHEGATGYQLTFPNGVMLRWVGFITAFKPTELLPNGLMEGEITITRSTGKPTLHAAA